MVTPGLVRLDARQTVHSLRQMHLVGVTRCLEETMEILLNMVGASGLYASVGRENTGHTVGVPASSQHAIDQLEREMIQTMIDNPQHWALDLELFRPFARWQPRIQAPPRHSLTML
eukprot:scaffold1403_cov381-Prasinococcus_capsulatus_cf.AAC.5